jgi:hypothetical protein
MIEKMGYDKGVKIGESNGINSVITTMLKKGFSIDVISDAAEKSKEYILKIKEEKNLVISYS